jgi:hypothetical protein
MALTEDSRADDARNDVEALIPEARELHRRRRRRRGAAGLLAAALLAGGGFVLINGGGGGGSHASVASVGVHGPLPAGIAARAADPAGSLPWGIRVVHTAGYTCVQLGRLRGDQLGLLGHDGLAGNNGRFYAMGPSTTYQARCAPNDGGSHAYMTVELGAQPASAAGGGYRGESMCRTAAAEVGLARVRARLKQRGITVPTGGAFSMPVCPSGDLRFVQYGLLGPDATSITYRISGAPQTERTGQDGAYLVVGPSTPAFCGRLDRGTLCGGDGVGPNSIGGGMIQAVRYRNASTCQLDRANSRLPPFALSCPRVGYVPAKPRLTDSQVAAPIRVRVINAPAYCLGHGGSPFRGFGPAPVTELALYTPCSKPASSRPGDVIHGTLVIFSWTARQPVTSPRRNYTFFFNEGRCGGQGGSTYGQITADERLTRAVILQPRPHCTGTFTGTVGFNPDLGPGGGDFGDNEPGRGNSLLVGRFTVPIHSSSASHTKVG